MQVLQGLSGPEGGPPGWPEGGPEGEPPGGPEDKPTSKAAGEQADGPAYRHISMKNPRCQATEVQDQACRPKFSTDQDQRASSLSASCTQ